MVVMGFRTRSIVLIALALITLFILILPAYAITLNADEQYMLNLLNKERRSSGLNALEIDPKLELMARRYGQEMIDHSFFSHSSPISGELLDRVNAAGVPDGWLLAGENLAGAPTVEAAFEGLMNSPSHKDNMLEPKYTHVGIGAIDGGAYGKMFVQEFVAYPKSMFNISNNPSNDLLIYINGQLLYSNPPAFISKGHTLVPVRQLFEALGANVMWQSEDKKINIIYPGGNTALTIGSDTALVNGTEVKLDAKPCLKNGSTFIPLRFVVENLGAYVKWSNALRTIDITVSTDVSVTVGASSTAN